MTTISKAVGRGDILLHRGSDERIGVKWQQWNYEAWQPVDIKSWNATFYMYWHGNKVYSLSCSTTSNGLAYADIPSSAFTADMWKAQANGSWKIIATNGEQTEILGWGNYSIQ